MDGEYLATGFRDVDAREDGSAYTGCLAFIDSLPYYRQCKEKSYELLGLAPGRSVLDVGSGLGGDAVRMAALVAPGGRVVGVDSSARMVGEAGARAPLGLPVEFFRADGRFLPFKDGTFERCRIDRTLQHTKSPEEVIREMHRVTAPGGSILAYDNDWATFTVSGGDHETTRIVETMWADSFASRWIGRYLKKYLLEAGFEQVEVYPSVSVVSDFESADRIYNLRRTVKRAVEAARLTEAEGEEWIGHLEDESAGGRFFCSLTAYTVTGVKP